MIKKSYRKRIQGNFGDPNTEEVLGKMNTIITLLNRCIYYTVSIPMGYYYCPECDSKKVFNFDAKGRRRMKTHYGMAFLIDTCKKCEGKGHVDFVSNVITPPKPQIGVRRWFSVPYYLLTKPKLEVASMIFYTLYYTDHFYDFGTKFELKAKHDKKTVKDFIDHFTKYKQKRDKRKKFLDENFTELRDQILKITKASDIPATKIACKVCDGKPFDIKRNRYNDDIRLTICGNCYGHGYQSKRDSKSISNYILDLDYPNYPKYNSKQEVLNIILATADINRNVFTLELGQIEFKEKKKKAA